MMVNGMNHYITFYQKVLTRDFPGGPVVKTLPSSTGGAGSIPGRGAKIPRASRPKKQKNIKKKRSNIVTNSIKTLKKKKRRYRPIVTSSLTNVIMDFKILITSNVSRCYIEKVSEVKGICEKKNR